MDKLPELILPEEWKQRTRVFITRAKPCAVMAPMVSKEMYDAERDTSHRVTGETSPSVAAARKSSRRQAKG